MCVFVCVCPVGGPAGCSTEERLRAELLLERRQSEAQATAFEEERRTWQQEKDKVIRYQRELQASYLEMHQRHQALEAQTLRPGRGAEGGGAGERRGTLEREMQEVRVVREGGERWMDGWMDGGGGRRQGRDREREDREREDREREDRERGDRERTERGTERGRTRRF